MLKLARENKHKAGVANAEFFTGEMEVFPLPDDHAAVVNKRQRHQSLRRDGEGPRRGVHVQGA